MDSPDLIISKRADSQSEAVIRVYAPTGPQAEPKITSFARSKVKYIVDGDTWNESEIIFPDNLRITVRLPREELEKKIYKDARNGVIDLTEETKPAPAPLPLVADDPNEHTRISIFAVEDFDDAEPISLADSGIMDSPEDDTSLGINIFDLSDDSKDDMPPGVDLLGDVFGSESVPSSAAGLFETPAPQPPKASVPEKPPGVLRKMFNTVFRRGDKNKKPKGPGYSYGADDHSW